MPRPWPPSMLERIAYYVNLGVRTNEIRTAIQREFPDQPWDERRFYNRLSDERSVFFDIKKIFWYFKHADFGEEREALLFEMWQSFVQLIDYTRRKIFSFFFQSGYVVFHMGFIQI